MNDKQFDALLMLTGIKSEAVIAAARDVLVNGVERKVAEKIHGAERQQLSTRLERLKNVERLVIKYMENS